MPAMLTAASPRMRPTVPTMPGRSAYVRNARWVVGSMSTSKPLTSTSRSFCARPTSVPLTETWVPSASVPRMVMRLRWSGLSRLGDQAHLGAALGGQQGRVHVGDLLLDDVGEDPLEGGQLEHLHVELGDLAAHLDVELLGDLAGQRGEDATELLRQRDAGAYVLGDHAALDVDRVGDELAAQRQTDGAGDGDAGLLLGLVRGRAEVRRGNDALAARRAGCRCTARRRRHRGRPLRSGRS